MRRADLQDRPEVVLSEFARPKRLVPRAGASLLFHLRHEGASLFRDNHARGEADSPPVRVAEPRAEYPPHLALGVDTHVPLDGMQHPNVHDGARGCRLPDVANDEGVA